MFTPTPSLSFLPQSQATLQIQQLVEAIVRNKQPAFRIKPSPAGENAEPTRIGTLLLDINSLLNVYGDNYDYSEHLLAFSQAYLDIGLERGFQGATCLDETGTCYLSFPRTMNRLVERIRELTQTTAFKRCAADRRYQSGENTARLEHYARGVLAKYSRTVVLRINLYYIQIVQPRLRIEHVYEDLRALLRARERNPIFAHETGFIWSMEQGGRTGSFHVHAAFFFNGAHERSDWAKGLQIGALWEQITQGWGYYHICDSSPGSYSKPGIGMIHRNVPAACENALEAIRYLAKDEQHLQVKPCGARTLGSGLLA